MKWYTHVTVALFAMYPIAYILDIQITIIGGILTMITALIPDFEKFVNIKHRGLGHSIAAIVVVGLFLGFFGFDIVVVGLIGLTSHIMLDLLTVHGCMLLYPFSLKRFVTLTYKNRIKTGHTSEKSIFIFFIVLLTITILTSEKSIFMLFIALLPITILMTHTIIILIYRRFLIDE